MFTYRTKLLTGFVALLFISLVVNIVDHLYIKRLYLTSTEVEDALLKFDYLSRFQLALERSLMPPNDYLIHGSPVEKTDGIILMKQVDTMFKITAKMDLTDEEQALLNGAQTKFEDVRHLSEEIFAIEDPVGNEVGSKLMKRMDTLAYEVQEDLEKIDVAHYEKTIGVINNSRLLYNFENKIYWISIFILIIFAAIIGLIIYRAADELERKTVALESAKREWERTFDAVEDYITINDMNNNVIHANKAIAKRFNTTPQALIGKKCYELFHGASAPPSSCPHTELDKTGKVVSVEIEDPYLGGTFLKSIYPLVNEKGEIYAILHTVKNITEMKKADQRVKDEAIINKAVLTAAKFISSTMDEESIIHEMVRITPSLVKCEGCMVLLWNEKQKAFLPGACHGFEAHHVPIFKSLRIKPEDMGVLDEIKKRKASIVIEDAINSPLLSSEFVNTFNIETIAFIPIIGRDKLIGIFVMVCTKCCKFSPRDIAIIEGIAAQTGIALENARLYRESTDRLMELEHRVETIQVMHEIGKDILSTLNKEEILETAAHMVRRVIPADRITVFLVDKEESTFKYVAGFGIDAPKGLKIPFNDTNATDAIRTSRLISRPNISVVKNLRPFDRQLIEQGFRSDIRIPIKVKGEIVALLNIGSHTVAAFTPEHLSTAEKLAAQFAVALEHAKLFSNVQELFTNTAKALTSAIDAKSPWTRGHSERVTKVATTIGKELGLSQKELEDLSFAGLFHDIGKIGTAEHIIDKPGKLTDEEFTIMKDHPLQGVEILKSVKQFANIIPGIIHHHERFDGKGYLGKQNANIHLLGKILAVADTYDAMVTDRPYRKAPGVEKAIDEIKRCSGTQFDPLVVDAFLKVVENGLLK
jgi:putative nucleotidyltransferase with HDIG domain